MKIYFACGLHGDNHGPLPGTAKKRYDSVGRLLRQQGYQVYMPHEEILPELTPEELRRHCQRKVWWADLMILDACLPAFGAGVELQWAKSWGLPIISYSFLGSPAETIVQGASSIYFEFSGTEQLERLILHNLKQFDAPSLIWGLRRARRTLRLPFLSLSRIYWRIWRTAHGLPTIWRW